MPENLPSFEIFSKVSTQWRTAPGGGVIGLDYNVVFRLLDRLAGDAWDEIFDDIRILEDAARQAINEG